MSKFEEFIEEHERKPLAFPSDYESGWEGGVNDVLDDLRELGKDYVLVPREPTEEMIEASTDWNDYATSNGGTPEEFNIAIYKAMIAAAEEIK